jgi:hypothetical protein
MVRRPFDGPAEDGPAIAGPEDINDPGDGPAIAGPEDGATATGYEGRDGCPWEVVGDTVAGRSRRWEKDSFESWFLRRDERSTFAVGGPPSGLFRAPLLRPLGPGRRSRLVQWFDLEDDSACKRQSGA